MENINLTLEQLKNLMIKYDLTNGVWPESRWQGSSVYHFILEELGIEYDVREYNKLLDSGQKLF